MDRIISECLNYITDVKVIRRKYYFSLIDNLVSVNGIFILTGQRRVGKSFVVLDFIKDKKKCFYFNKELDDKEVIKTNIELSLLFDRFVEKYGNPEYVVIDEIQDIKGREVFVRKVFALKKYKIIVTGSNSKLLSGEISTYIGGRYIQTEIYPLTFDEYFYFSEVSGKKISNSDGNKVLYKKDLFVEYLEFGGLPDVFFVDKEYKKNYIKSIKDSIVLKDVVDRFKVQNVSVLEKLIQYLSNTTGSLVSTSNINNYFKSNFDKNLSSSTISRYLEFIKTTFLVNESHRYDLHGKKILEYVSKYYFSDIGIRNALGYNFAFDVGKILENIVYISLKSKGWEVFVGDMPKGEIDFVGEKNGKKIYIQVAYLITDEKVANREFGNMLLIRDNRYKYVVTMDKNLTMNYEGVKHIHVMDIDSIL